MASAKKHSTPTKSGRGDEFLEQLERATRGLLALNVSVLEQLEKRNGLTPLRALQSLDRLGPSLVTELGDDLNLLSSTASRLSDRLAEAGYITRRVSPTNRRATLLELTDDGRARQTDRRGAQASPGGVSGDAGASTHGGAGAALVGP